MGDAQDVLAAPGGSHRAGQHQGLAADLVTAWAAPRYESRLERH
ncbi:hypothetical protein [Streptomyces sp. NPDC001508]